MSTFRFAVDDREDYAVRLLDGDEKPPALLHGMVWAELDRDGRRTQFLIKRDYLVEVKPPIPPEPEPGAYMIGEVLCYVYEPGSSVLCVWPAHHSGWVSWSDAWETHFGSDVSIRPMVALPEVELPWLLKLSEVGDSVEVNVLPGEHDEYPVVVEISDYVAGGSKRAFLHAGQALAMAAALVRAAAGGES